MNIQADEETGELIIDGKRIAAFKHDSVCDTCAHYLIHYNKYDAYFCPQCNEWKEQKCLDPECEYCKERPDKPL